MNAVVEDPRDSGTQASTANMPRLYAGQGAPVATPADYVSLLPTDQALDRATVLRAFVADALQRNGRTVDEETLAATIAYAQTPSGGLADVAFALGPQTGATIASGSATLPDFKGYALTIPATEQRNLLDYAATWTTQHQAAKATETPDAALALIAQIRALANTAGAGSVVATLDNIEAAIKSGNAASAAGASVGESALRGVLEFAARSGHERDAAKVLERYTALKGITDDAKKISDDAQRVFHGIDPATGKPINADQRVDAAFDMVSNGFKTAGEIGVTATLFGAAETGLVGSLIGIAPAGIAIVAFAEGAYHLIKHLREKILEPQWNEFRERFPFAEGLEPKHAITAAMRQIAGMPTGADNAVATATRIIDLLGESEETRGRFLAFLKTKVQPASLVDAIAEGKGLTSLSAEDAAKVARAAKGSAREFLDLELKDTKHYIHQKDSERQRGAYLPASVDRTTTLGKVQAGLGEGVRVLDILTSSANELNGMVKDMLGKVKGVDGAPSKLTDAQQHNLAAAIIPAAKNAGLTQVDHLLPSADGSKLFAVQGDPQSATRKMVAIDIGSAANQSVEVSSRLAAQGVNQASLAQETTQAQTR